MFKNYLKIALRQLKNQKMYAVIKVGGFALGIAVCLLIGLYIRYESGYDREYPDSDRIYRVVGVFEENGKTDKSVDFPAPMAAALKNDFPEIERSGRWMSESLFEGAGNNQFRTSNSTQNTYEQGFVYADQETLNILRFPMVDGSSLTALSQPNTMVITKRKADKYFRGENPIGQVVYLNNNIKTPYTISGVIQNIPQNSHLRSVDFILSLANHQLWNGEQTDWNSANYVDYVLVRKGVNPQQLCKKLTAGLLNKYFIPAMIKYGVVDARKKASQFNIVLQPVAAINLRSYDINDRLPHGDIRFIWLFGAVALFILVIACINFVNLSTAKSANRAKEVGLRKVVGSQRSSLIAQFLTESTVYSLISFALGLLLAQMLLPYFNTFAGRQLIMPWSEALFIPAMFLAALIVGIIAGLYPAFYLSAFSPIQVLKGSISSGSKSSMVRNSLVVFQFAASVILVIGTIVIYDQMQFIMTRDAGFDKDQVVMIQGTNTLTNDQVRAFKNELLRLPAVKSATISDFLPVEGTKRNGNTYFNEGQTAESGIQSQVFQIDEDYLKTMGIKLADGRNFSPAMATDSNAVLINETMARQLHLKNAVGKRIVNDGITYPIIGVVKDFNFNSMHSTIDPLVMRWGFSPSIVSAKINGGDAKAALTAITGVWKSFSPGQSIRYTFLDEQFAAMYADVLRTGRIFTVFAVLAIVIACLGLFALSAFMAEQRSKEIGIRKVLGATVSSITTLLAYDFVKLVLLAIVIASPIGWWAMNSWLQDFAYRTSISWWVFAAAGAFAVLIALLTVSFQSVKAALANPARILKSE